MKVKICGLTTLEDALAALEAGADLLGFNFYPPSPRFIPPAKCAALVGELRKRGCTAALVGVFVNASAEQMQTTLELCQLDLAQLSGDESPETLAQLGPRAFKALRPANPTALADSLNRYTPRPTPPAWLVDAYRAGEYGGTGQTADWRLASGLARQAPILLAGGLNPGNVAEAVRQVQPWGVDVASGVESTPGRKDTAKMRTFIAAARTFEEKTNP
jgi:phosphoribosylanthranilate isomerase